MQGVRGGYFGGICGGSQDESAWASNRGATELENLGHGVRATDLSNGLSCQGRPADLPSGGMLGPSGEKDVNEGSLPIPACPVHCSHSRGGKPPPPTLHLMQHAGPP